MASQIWLLTWFAVALNSVKSLKCYECAQQGPNENDCTTRECIGVWCLTTTVTDVDEGIKLTLKSCADFQPIEFDTQTSGSCKNIVTTGTQYTICACNIDDYCNNQSTIAKTLSILDTNAAFVTPPSVSRIKCRECSISTCDATAALCEDQWCLAEIIFDKMNNKTTVSKRCSNQSHNGKEISGCAKVEGSSVETTLCACNQHLCTDDEPLSRLVNEFTIPAIDSNEIVSASPSHIADGTLSPAEALVADADKSVKNATNDFLLAKSYANLISVPFSISFLPVVIEFWLIMCVC